jgi:hypothetical protein
MQRSRLKQEAMGLAGHHDVEATIIVASHIRFSQERLKSGHS